MLKLWPARESCLLAAMDCLLWYLNDRLVIAFPGTGAADGLGAEFDFTAKIDSFTALRTDNPLTFIAGKLFRWEFHVHGLRLKELFVGHLTIGQHLLLVLVFNFRVHAFGQGFGRLAGGHAHG